MDKKIMFKKQLDILFEKIKEAEALQNILFKNEIYRIQPFVNEIFEKEYKKYYEIQVYLKHHQTYLKIKSDNKILLELLPFDEAFNKHFNIRKDINEELCRNTKQLKELARRKTLDDRESN